MSHYEWDPKERPPIIKHHSLAKHDILRSYLVAYIQTLVASHQMREFKLTLVDGFAGGGIYRHEITGEPILGSPFVMLDAVREAECLVNQNRPGHPVHFIVHYFFIEKKRSAHEVLLHELKSRGYAKDLQETIYVRRGGFEGEARHIIDFVLKKSPRGARAIFLLDQYGFTEVPASLIRNIMTELKGSEVILNFAVDSFLTYAGDNAETKKKLERIGIPDFLRGRSIEDIKANDKKWRLFIQSCLYQELVAACGAQFFTPFFIRASRGHGDYWLLHFSQRPRARDVMTRIHWEKNNYFIHYGGPGLDMFNALGYVTDKYRQPELDLGFCFDASAKESSVGLLREQIPDLVYGAGSSGLSFSTLFSTTCNSSPASAGIYKDALGELLAERDIEIISEQGGKRRSKAQIHDSDVIVPPSQFRLIF